MIIRYMEVDDTLSTIDSQEHFRFLTINFADWYRQLGKNQYAEPLIVSKAWDLLKMLTANDKNSYKLNAFLVTCPSVRDLEVSTSLGSEIRLTLEQICLICIDACSEIAAADDVFIVNYNNTGKRHKLKKLSLDPDI